MELDEILERHTRAIELRLKRIGPVDAHVVLRHHASGRWALVTQEPGDAAKWRCTWFGVTGFTGHSVCNSKADALSLAVTSGYHSRDDGALDRIQDSRPFQRGNLLNDLVMRINAGEISHQQATAQLAKFDGAHSLAIDYA